jgi:hypothetical protein
LVEIQEDPYTPLGEFINTLAEVENDLFHTLNSWCLETRSHRGIKP